jgi:hypothetical protein
MGGRTMYRLMLLTLSLGLAFAVAAGAKDDPKSTNDPAKAGPDFLIQGEYLGELDKGKLGAEVIARGDGKFDVNFLPGGLRGEGGDYSKKVEGTAKTESGKVTVASKDGKWTATISESKLAGKNGEGQAFTLSRVIRKSKTEGQKPPEGALVLFDGTSADQWVNGKVVDGNLLGSDIDSKKEFQDHKAHVEFRLTYVPFGRGQGRSNSGVYLQHRYEVQVLDSFGLKGENNECGGVYSMFAPKVNMCYPPLQWQTYDIEFKTARFQDGKKVSPAVISVWHNGVLIQDKVEPKSPTGGGRAESEKPGPLFLQGHGGGVQYRNIWVVETK